MDPVPRASASVDLDTPGRVVGLCRAILTEAAEAARRGPRRTRFHYFLKAAPWTADGASGRRLSSFTRVLTASVVRRRLARCVLVRR